jgi:hypothetical protein
MAPSWITKQSKTMYEPILAKYASERLLFRPYNKEVRS